MTRVVLTIHLDEDFVRGELWWQDEHWAEVLRRNGEWRLLLSPRSGSDFLDIPLEQARAMIDEAVARITLMESGPGTAEESSTPGNSEPSDE